MIIKFGNYFIGLILSSPLHGLISKNTLLINFTGRKSGKKYRTPVNFSRADNKVWITSQPERVWWRNFNKHPIVQLTMYGKSITGTAVVLKPGQEAADGFEYFLRPNPQYAKYYKVSIDQDGNFISKDLIKASEGLVIIEITID